jgi:hypothetical protein
MSSRSVEDKLREEYFDLLPEIRRVADHLEAEVRYHILPVSRTLEPFERVLVRSRIKDCDSAVESLRRRQHQEGATFDAERISEYTLMTLKDLAGVRVLTFPRSRMTAVNEALRGVPTFRNWTADHVIGGTGDVLAFKYSGLCDPASTRVAGEYQVVSVMTGLFWDRALRNLQTRTAFTRHRSVA